VAPGSGTLGDITPHQPATRDRPPSVRAVDLALPRPRPERVSLDGERVRVEPLDPERHGSDLFRLGHDGTAEAEQSWEYMPYGPFASEAEHQAWLATQAAGDDPLFFVIVDRREDRAVGVATLLSIVPAHGSIELGHIWLSPGLQRTPAATEALVLLLRYALDDLGYRRMEWKCNAANAASRSAATRLGFRFEGIFYNHLVFKGRNRDTAWFSILDEEWPPLREAYATWLAAGNFDADGTQRRRLGELTVQMAPRAAT
jgi:RimJ/RimL family protein N-acetyltransferase